MKTRILVAALSAFAILTGGVFTAIAVNGQQSTSYTTAQVTEQPNADMSPVTEVVITRPIESTITTTTTEPAIAQETTISTTVATTVATEAETTIVTKLVTYATEPDKTQAQLLAESILSQLNEHLDTEYCAPAVWNAWERQLLFVDTYNELDTSFTNDTAIYNWLLADNPNDWQISIGTSLTDDFGDVDAGFKMPAGVDDYSQFMYTIPSKLDQDNLGDYVYLTDGETEVKIYLHDCYLCVATRVDGEDGHATGLISLPEGWIVVCHTVYEESEVFDESIGSAIAAYRTFGAFDQRCIDVVEAIAHLDIVTGQ